MKLWDSGFFWQQLINFSYFCQSLDHWKVIINYQLTVSRCVRWCFALSDELLNAFVHPACWHTYGRSPVWDRKWIFRFSSLENAFSHPSYCKCKVIFMKKTSLIFKIHQKLILERALQANLKTFQSVSCHFILPIYRSPQR